MIETFRNLLEVPWCDLRSFLRLCTDPQCPSAQRRWRGLLRRNEGIWLHEAWYCCQACFEHSARAEIERLLATAASGRPNHQRLPLGLLMLERGMITEQQLKTALEAQRCAGQGRIGDWLRQIGAADERMLTSALGQQWSCPVFAGNGLAPAGLVPLQLNECYRMLPVRWAPAQRRLWVAFAGNVDYRVLHAIEGIVECRTEPCVIPEGAFQRHLEALRLRTAGDEIVFNGLAAASEMVRVISAYAAQLQAEEARFAPCSRHLWAGLRHHGRTTHLLFDLAASPPETSVSTG